MVKLINIWSFLSQSLQYMTCFTRKWHQILQASNSEMYLSS